ncbi:AAWKG family protein [Streptomyces sp. AA1529]|uniref:AAWKG family protein n=1 Tax=Streptomyces sp. AA1529 TaxID=1203257 RepID=UPI003D72E0D8
MADETLIDKGNDDWWSAVSLFTGYTPPSVTDALDQLKSHDGIPFMHVTLEKAGNNDLPEDEETAWQDENFYNEIGKMHFKIPFYTYKDGDLTKHHAWIQLIGIQDTKQGIDDGGGKDSFKESDVDSEWGGEDEKGDTESSWDTSQIAQYSYGSGEALRWLLEKPHGTKGFNWNPAVTDSTFVDPSTFESTALAFDRFRDFVGARKEILEGWEKTFGKTENDKWKGQAAGVWWNLVHLIVRRYERLADDMQDTANRHVGLAAARGSKQAAAVRYVGMTLLDEAQNLRDAWESWVGDHRGWDGGFSATVSSNPLYHLVDILGEIMYNIWMDNLTKAYESTESNPSGYTSLSAGYSPDTTSVNIQPGFSSEAKDRDGKLYGQLDLQDTWKKIGEEAKTRWWRDLREKLGGPGETAKANLKSAIATAVGDIGEIRPASGQDLQQSLQSDQADRDRKEAADERAKQEAENERIRKEMEEQRAEDLAAAEAERERQDKLREEAEAKADKQRAEDLARQKAEQERQDKLREEAEAKADKQRAEDLARQEELRKEQEAKEEELRKEQEAKEKEQEAKQEELRKEQEAKEEELRKEQEAKEKEQEAKQEQRQKEQEQRQEEQQRRQEEQQQQQMIQQRIMQEKQRKEQQRQRAEDIRRQEEQEAKQEARQEEQEAKQEAKEREQEAKQEELRKEQEAKEKEQEAKQEQLRKEQEAKEKEQEEKQEQIRQEQEAKQDRQRAEDIRRQEEQQARQEQQQEEQQARQEELRKEQEAKQEEQQQRQEQEQRRQEERQQQEQRRQEERQDAQRRHEEERQDAQRRHQEQRQDEQQRRQEQLQRRQEERQQQLYQDRAGDILGDQRGDSSYGDVQNYLPDDITGPVNGDDSLTNPGGSHSHLDPHGRIVTEYPDGSRTTIDPQTQTSTIVDPDGASHSGPLNAGDVVTNPDGSVSHLDSHGQVVTEYPDGSRTTVDPRTGATTQTSPDGTTTSGYLNGAPGPDVPGSRSPGDQSDYEPELYDPQPGGGQPGAGQPNLGQGGSPGGMPMSPMMGGGMGGMGGGGGQGQGGSSERTRNVIDSGGAMSNRRRPAAARAAGRYDEREARVNTSGSSPYFPGSGANGGQGQQQTQSGDRERDSWVDEDEDVWGSDEGGSPAVIGR